MKDRDRKPGAAGEVRAVVHCLSDALAVLEVAAETGRPAVLVSAPGAAGYAGPLWFLKLAERARKTYPGVATRTVLDCAGDAGYVLAAIRENAADAVVFTGPRELHVRLEKVASEAGIAVLDGRPEALDLSGCEAARETLRKAVAGD